MFSSYSFCTPGIRGIISLIFMFLAGSILGSAVIIALGSLLGTEFTAEYGMLISYPLSFVPAMAWAALQSKKGALLGGGYAPDSDNFAPMNGKILAVLSVLATIIFAYIYDITMSLMPPMPQWLEEALESVTNGKLWVNLLCVSVMAPICEEWLCRGMILRGLLYHTRLNGVKGYRPASAIIASAFIFALIHMNPWQAIPAFLMGCLFGFVYYRTGSLKLTMLMHCANNTFAVLLSRVPAFEEVDTWIEVLGPVKYWAIWALCAVAAVFIVKAFLRVEMDSVNGNCDPTVADTGKETPQQ